MPICLSGGALPVYRLRRYVDLPVIPGDGAKLNHRMAEDSLVIKLPEHRASELLRVKEPLLAVEKVTSIILSASGSASIIRISSDGLSA